MNNPPGPSNNVNGQNNIGNQRNHLSDVDLFKEICGIDEASAAALLRESGGNLEAAIHQFFFTRENHEVLQNQDNEVQELRRRAVANRQDPTGVPSVPPPLPVALPWAQWLRGLALIPFHYLYSTAMDIFFFVYNLFFGPPPSNRRPIAGIANQNLRPARPLNVLADRIIMREQQKAYEQALAIDKQKTEQRKMEERRAQEEADKANDRKMFLREKRAEIAAKIMPEPEEMEGAFVRLRITFPSCTKVERNFRNSDSLERLFEVVFVHPDCPDNFSLFTNFPVKQLNCAPNWYRSEFCVDELVDQNDGSIETFADAELFKSANVVVRDNDA